MDAPRLVDGLFREEAADATAWRWTNGRLRLPRALWEGCASEFFLRVFYNRESGTRWLSPESPASNEADRHASDNVVRLQAI